MFLFSSKDLSLGQWGELMAQREYKKRGCRILGRNVFNRSGKRFGEIDFIARNQEVIIFVEVKTRIGGSDRFGGAAQAVDFYKQRKLLKIVKIFLLNHPQYSGLRPQIDVCLVIANEVDRRRYSVTILANAVEDQ